MDSQKLTNAVIEGTGRTYRRLVLTSLEAPKSLFGRTLWSLGFVTKHAHNRKIQEVVDEANRFIQETTVADRQVMMENQELADQQTVKTLVEGHAGLMQENADLRRKVQDFEKENSTLRKALATEQAKSTVEKKTAQEIQQEKEQKEKEVALLKSELAKAAPKPSILLYQKYGVKPTLTDEEISGIMKMGYELIADFYDLDGQRGTYYVKKNPGENLQHAALRHMVYEEALSNSLNAKTAYGSEADVELETRRGKLIGLEIHDGSELKNPDAMLERMDRLKKKYGDFVIVTLEPDKARYTSQMIGRVIGLYSPTEVKALLKRYTI